MSCKGCGKCCSSILPISKEEKNIILDYIDKHNVVAYNYNKDQNIFNTEYKNICPFLNPESNRCQIYEVRPEICRRYECSDRLYEFDHNGKKIENFYEQFFPDINILYKPDARELDGVYQEKKKGVGLN